MVCLSENPPGENIFAGIRVRKGAELSDHNTLLCDGSHIAVCFEKPKCRREWKTLYIHFEREKCLIEIHCCIKMTLRWVS